MTQAVSNSDGVDFDIDAPLTLEDYIEIIGNDLDEAVDHCKDRRDVDRLCRTIQKKIGSILRENSRRRLDEPPERDAADRWWDR